MRAKLVEKSSPNIINDGFSAFIEEIRNGNVLLMIGRAFEANTAVFGGDFFDYILKELNIIAGTKDLDFSELNCDNRFLFDRDNYNHIRNLHEEIIKLVEKNDYFASKQNNQEQDVSEGLMSLIRTGFFRFVFTTTFDPLVEVAMKEQFGEVRIMNIYDKYNRDIKNKEDLAIPTVYYLFGKAMMPKENEATKKFVATDNDALEVLRKWQVDMSNSSLLRYTADKYLLTLGCTQKDWLFRFIWYTLKGEGGKLSRGVVAGHERSDSLSHYLKMNNILLDNDAEVLTTKILNALYEDDKIKWETPQTNCDVFISYSRTDSDIASRLYNSLTAQGLKVWYDKFNLGGRHGGKFKDVLRESIDTSTLFIAILTQSVSEQARDIHVYRREWEWAKEFKMGLTADCRCFAAFADNYDIYANKYKDGLGWLAETDNYIFSAKDPNFDDWVKVLQNKIIDIRSHGRS